MKHDQTPGSQNCKIGSGRISKMVAVTKNSKNNMINFSSTTGYFWLNFGMEYQLNIGIQNRKNEENLWRGLVTLTYFLFTSLILFQFACLKITYLNNFFSKTIAPFVVKFHMKHDQTPGSKNCKIGSGGISKIAKTAK